MQVHFQQCPACRQALDELSIIRAALASRPVVTSPPGGEWSGFMARLAAGLEREGGPGFRSFDERAVDRDPAWMRTAPSRNNGMFSRPRVIGYVAMAALLVLVTAGVLVLAPERGTNRVEHRSAPDAPAAAVAVRAVPQPDPALVSLSGSHFERSKLVLLELATTDSESLRPEEWSRDRERAAALLNDTRVYRLAAEERGMNALAGVMRDLELVLLQTSMSENPDAESVEHLQQLIRRRNLLTKMDVVFASGP